MKKRSKNLFFVLNLLIVAGMFLIINIEAQAEKQKTYNLTWIPTGTKGTTYGVSVAAGTLINKYSPLPGLPKIQIAVVPGKGSTVHTRQLIKGEIDIGLSSPGAASAAYRGEGVWAKFGTKGKTLRVLLPATVMATQIYVLKSGPVKTFDDIKGKRLAELSKAGSMSRVNAAVWKAAGLDPDKDMKTTYYATLSAQLDALRDGHADVAIMTQGYPSSGPTELFTVKDAAVIPIPIEIAKKAAAQSRSWFTSIMPANIYPKQDYPVQTLGLILFWGVTSKMPDQIAYEICKILHEHQKEGTAMWGPFGQFAPDLFVDFGVPLHRGAKKYWKEIGWVE